MLTGRLLRCNEEFPSLSSKQISNLDYWLSLSECPKSFVKRNQVTHDICKISVVISKKSFEQSSKVTSI